MSRRVAHSWVYFIRRADGCVKIGYSADPAHRFMRLGEVHGKLEILSLTPGGRKAEVELHERFAHLRRNRSEWFRDEDGSISAAVMDLVATHGPPPDVLPSPQRRQLLIRLSADEETRLRELIADEDARAPYGTPAVSASMMIRRLIWNAWQERKAKA